MEKKGLVWVKILTVLGSVALILGLLIASIEMFAVNEVFFSARIRQARTEHCKKHRHQRG